MHSGGATFPENVRADEDSVYPELFFDLNGKFSGELSGAAFEKAHHPARDAQ